MGRTELSTGIGQGINIKGSGYGHGIFLLGEYLSTPWIDARKKREAKRKTNLEGRLTYIEIKELEKEGKLLNKGRGK